jgi:hypothetical protein
MKTMVEIYETLSEPSLRLTQWIDRCWSESDGLDTKLSQSIDDCLDQPFDLPVIGVTDMLVAALTTDVRSQVVELASDRTDLETAKAFRQDRAFEPVVQVIRQHLDQQKQLVTLFVFLAVLVKGEAFLEFIDLVLDVAALVVVMEDLGRGHGLDVGHDELVGILHRIEIHPLLFLVIDWSRLPDQDESVALVPLGQAKVDFVDAECVIDDRPRVKMLLMVDPIDENLQTTVFLALDDEFEVLAVQISEVVDVKAAAVDANPGQRPFLGQQQPALSNERFQFKVGVVLAVFQGQVDHLVGRSQNPDLFLERGPAMLGGIVANAASFLIAVNGAHRIVHIQGHTARSFRLGFLLQHLLVDPTDLRTSRFREAEQKIPADFLTGRSPLDLEIGIVPTQVVHVVEPGQALNRGINHEVDDVGWLVPSIVSFVVSDALLEQLVKTNLLLECLKVGQGCSTGHGGIVKFGGENANFVVYGTLLVC